MEKFRKKPVVVESQRYTAETCAAICEWMGIGHGSETDRCGLDPFVVETLEGPMKASPGDYIIKGVKGEFYPCRADIFALTYEPADSQPEPMVPLRPVIAIEAAFNSIEDYTEGDPAWSDAVAAAIRAAREGAGA